MLSEDFTGFDQSAALADTDYFTFTLTAANGSFPLDLNSLTFSHGITSSSSNAQDIFSHVIVQSTVTGFGTGNGLVLLDDETINKGAGIASNFEPVTANISGASYDSVTTMTFQVRFWDTRSGQNRNFNRIDDLVIIGDVSVIPEPSTFALLGLGGLSLLLLRRRQS
jgi:hypothetical protein